MGAVPPCRHIFNMINDIDRMDRQRETVSKFSNAEQIVPRLSIRVGADLCVCPHLGGLTGPPLHSGRKDNEKFVPRSEINLDF
ncbi:hypothetical protein Desti_1043 [Desulfomonile tiedjei DSM 6799]|uniref:Uncharacterized protein n=1 Tax=Desulfomonile tiedjei (strain ATCC 49306 / DSM 6799 / DCB-1) TaxID=706587 RepID=I4C2G8_DESTA|nr:hypothetical protein Desti_1043 [Desulfomonile tiedjei DSM 6799]